MGWMSFAASMVKLNLCIIRIKITPRYLATTIYGNLPTGITSASGCTFARQLISVVAIMPTDG